MNDTVTMKSLADVCDILDSQRIPVTARDRVKGCYPYYGANGIQDYVDKYIFDDELVLLAEDGGNFGSKESPIAYRVSGKCWVNNHAHVLKPHDNTDVDYLCYALMFYNTEGLVNGATRQKLTQSAMKKMMIPFCDLKRQQEIVNELNAVSHLISLRQRQAEKLDELVKARFVEMFGDPVRNTKQFPLVEVQDLYDVSSSKRVYQDEMVLDGIPFLRISDIVEKSTNDKCTPQCFISQEMYDQLSQKGLTPNVGDILVTSRGTLGLCYEVKPGEKFYFQDGMISWLYNRKDCVINTYLLYAFRMPGIRKQIDGSNDGSTVSYLSIARLKRLKIELPPLALQTEFSHFVHEVDREKERIQRSAALLETLKRSLMQQYFG